MRDNVIHIPGIAVASESPDVVLEKAKSWEMEHCLVVGHDDAGDLMFGGTTGDLEKIITLLERAKHWVFTEMDD